MQEDLFSGLVKKLGFLPARAIILQQIKNLDALSIMRLMRESRLLRGIIGEGEDVWGSHMRKLDSDYEKKRKKIVTYQTCYNDNNPHITFTTAFLALFPTTYQQFLLSWTRLPHVWIDRASKQILQVQDWSLFVDSVDLEEDKLWFRHLLGRTNDMGRYFALGDDTEVSTSLIAVRMPEEGSHKFEWLEPSKRDSLYAMTCERFDYLLRNPLRRKLSLTAVPGQWVRLSVNGKDVALPKTRYASKRISNSFPKGRLFSFWIEIRTRPNPSMVLISFIDGKFVKEDAIYKSPGVDFTNRIQNLSAMLVPFFSCPDDLNVSPTFETCLFFENWQQSTICVRIDVIQGTSNHPNNFSDHGLRWAPRKLFRFQLMNIVEHYTDSDPTIDAPITVGLCDACQTQPIAVQCGNDCGTAFYCGQECADSHVNQHKCY